MDLTSAPPVTIVQNPGQPERSQAVALLLADRSDDGRQALQQALSGVTPADDAGVLLAALRGNRVVGAALLRRQPGRTALAWSPRLASGEPAQTAAELLSATLEVARDWQCSLVQGVLEARLDAGLDALVAAGFEQMAELLLLVCWLQEAPARLSAQAFELVPYHDSERPRLARVIESTYEGTLDCPRLNGVRQIGDVIAGHQATGAFDPQHWFFVRQAGHDIGCLLLANHPAVRQWEVVYVGLTPAARGRGWGLQLIQTAQSLARQQGAAQLVLAVDAANTPAVEAYLAAGFVVWDRRAVYLKILAPH